MPSSTSAPISEAQHIVARMIAGWEDLNANAVADCFAEDGLWHNMPYAPVVGREAIRVAVAKFLSGMTSAEFRVHNQGEVAPGIFMNERNDLFRTRDGQILDFAVAGIFETEGGLIRAWRDYFDSALMSA